MPSPLGHALGGIAAGWVVAGVDARTASGAGDARSRLRALAPTLTFATLGALPDLDLLVGLHSRYTHSLGAAVLVAALAALAFDRVRLVARVAAGPKAGDPSPQPSPRKRGEGARKQRRDPARLVFAVACGAAYGSHILLDWLGSDTTAPIGIMALWPLSSAFYQSDLHWFAAISRRYWLPEFFRMNALAAVREILILGPVVILVGAVRGVWTRRRAPAPGRRG